MGLKPSYVHPLKAYILKFYLTIKVQENVNVITSFMTSFPVVSFPRWRQQKITAKKLLRYNMKLHHLLQ